MSGLTKSISPAMFGPYSIDEIPKFTIDYRGMVAYARSQSKKVVDLSDSEKEMFIQNASMEEIRAKAIKIEANRNQ